MRRAGRVGRPHGLDGSFHVVEATPGLLVADAAVRAGELDTVVVGVKGTDEHPIVRLEGASDRNAAEALRGAELIALDAPPRELDDDEYPAEDLVGCSVVDGDRRLGEVVRLLAYPSCEVLELDSGLLVPMVRDAVKAVDVAGKVIAVDAGFLGAA